MSSNVKKLEFKKAKTGMMKRVQIPFENKLELLPVIEKEADNKGWKIESMTDEPDLKHGLICVVWMVCKQE